MSNSLPLLVDHCPDELPVLWVARSIADSILASERVDRPKLNALMTRAFAGSDAEGRWNVRDAHAAVEIGQVLWLRDASAPAITSDPLTSARLFDRAASLLPRQYVRSEEQIELQQFATPPRLAWLAAYAAGILPSDCVLEPSAGTGMLAIWAQKVGCSLVLNEISPVRRAYLAELFPGAQILGHDGELLDDLLYPSIRPSVVLMNPPYSHGLERGHDSKTCTRHLRAAWKRLSPDGRLVAILPEWFDTRNFLAWVKGPAALRANLALDRAFVAQGTSISTRLIVLDKTTSDALPVLARTADFRQLCTLVGTIARRGEVTHRLLPPMHPPARLTLVRSGASGIRPLPPVRSAAAGSAVSCAFEALEQPAPVPEQVGHYLPYRPSRIRISDACDHPTALVESVAMGSITAPVPSTVPQLPSGLIARGGLSAAQAETLIYAVSAHARDLPGKFRPEDKGCTLVPDAYGQSYRLGYFLGDGTGAGMSIGVQSGPPIGAQKGPPCSCGDGLMLGAGFALLAA